MGTLSYTIPTPGSTLNSVADPEVATALQTLLTWANGNIDASNISPASGYARLVYRTASSNTTVSPGDWTSVAAGVTVTLPAPTTANQLVAISAFGTGPSGSNPVTVSGTNIYGVGLIAASSFKLGTPMASVLLQSDGANWQMVSGRQDTGWVALTLAASWGTVVGTYVPAGRLTGDRVELRGVAQNNTGGSSAGIATLPAAFVPGSIVRVPTSIAGGTVTPGGATVSGTGLTAISAVTNTQQIALDGASYSIS